MQTPSEEEKTREHEAPLNLNSKAKKNGRVAPCDHITVPASHGNPTAAMNSPGSSLDCSSAPLKPHTSGGDVRWDAITGSSPLGLTNFRLLKRLGYGDIGSVYLVELRGTNALFAMKVMDKRSLASRNKVVRAETEREILGLLDHPFLPTLYTYLETDKFNCLVQRRQPSLSEAEATHQAFHRGSC